MTGENLKTAPTLEPVSVDELRAHCRITSHDEDQLLVRLIKAARQYVEDEADVQLITQTWEYFLDDFPSGDGVIWLPRAPVQSVTTLSYIDTDGDSQTLTEDTDFDLDIRTKQGRIEPYYNTSWPSVRTGISRVTIEYVVGFGATAASLDKSAIQAKQAILMLAGYWFDNRNAYEERSLPRALSLSVANLISHISIPRVK